MKDVPFPVECSAYPVCMAALAVESRIGLSPLLYCGYQSLLQGALIIHRGSVSGTPVNMENHGY